MTTIKYDSWHISYIIKYKTDMNFMNFLTATTTVTSHGKY